MENKPLISICIPTRNREKELKRLIESIVLQKWFTSEVSIVIHDNNSTDNTESMIKEYQKKYINITYIKSNKNIWIGPAILKVISLSNGEYTWLFGSDDLMHQDALDISINAIKKRSPTLILSNRGDNVDIQDQRHYIIEKINYRYFNWFADFWSYIWLDEKEKYSDKVNYFSFISIFCFKTNYYKEMFDFVTKSVCEISELNKHSFSWALIVFAQLYTNEIICLIDDLPLVYIHKDAQPSWKADSKISKDFFMFAKYLKNNYSISKNCKKILNKVAIGWRVWCVIIPAVHKLPLLGNLSSSISNNQTFKGIYYKIIKYLT